MFEVFNSKRVWRNVPLPPLANLSDVTLSGLARSFNWNSHAPSAADSSMGYRRFSVKTILSGTIWINEFEIIKGPFELWLETQPKLLATMKVVFDLMDYWVNDPRVPINYTHGKPPLEMWLGPKYFNQKNVPRGTRVIPVSPENTGPFFLEEIYLYDKDGRRLHNGNAKWNHGSHYDPRTARIIMANGGLPVYKGINYDTENKMAHISHAMLNINSKGK